MKDSMQFRRHNDGRPSVWSGSGFLVLVALGTVVLYALVAYALR